MTTKLVKVLFEQVRQPNKMGFNVNETIKLLYYGINRNITMSWGVSNYFIIDKKSWIDIPASFKIPQLKEDAAYKIGLGLKVNAHHHKGYVLITLNSGDYYDVDIITTHGNIKKQFTDLCFEDLVETIDKEIEYVDTYKY